MGDPTTKQKEAQRTRIKVWIKVLLHPRELDTLLAEVTTTQPPDVKMKAYEVTRGLESCSQQLHGTSDKFHQTVE
ncbi:hypothetical protein Y1Q_0018555 [Alligator mississippiensis]|uniref:Uncharacterized protein n=1 Tax=Alligator mississippiensis TaxID=8496 RepID=A0A151PGX4_ALLMI|nr:hypothetical protein Y1Q_0018555 [Alligator mississippiensis]